MICLNLDLCFHLWGSQQFEVMPGAKRPVEYFLQREMTETGLTENELFEYRENEYPHIRGGTVSLIPREDTERVLDLLQECLRLRIELGALVSYIKRRFYCFLDNCWQGGQTPGFHCLAPVFEL